MAQTFTESPIDSGSSAPYKLNEPDGFPFYAADSGGAQTFRTDSVHTVQQISVPESQESPILLTKSNGLLNGTGGAVIGPFGTPPHPKGGDFADSRTTQDAHHGPNLQPGVEGMSSNGGPTHQGSSPKSVSRLNLFTTLTKDHTRTRSALSKDRSISSDNAWNPKEHAEVLRLGKIASEPDAQEMGGKAEDRESEAASAQREEKIRGDEADITHAGPTTPRHRNMNGASSSMLNSASGNNPVRFIRSATMSDIPEHDRAGWSEDEGRDRLSKRGAWKRRGSSWMHGSRLQSSSTNQSSSIRERSEGGRPSNFRRLTHLGSSANVTDGSPGVRRVRSEIGAQKWRQLKAGLKLLGQKKREENKIDETKSTELMAQLFAGSPAALIFASRFQRDEHDKHKIPVFLELLKINITDSQRKEDSSGNRHVVFRVQLEYGSGGMRMKWIIYRSLRDFVNLHLKYKLHCKTQKYLQRRSDDSGRVKLPRFPKAAFPYLRGVRGLADDDEEEEDPAVNEIAIGGGTANPTNRPGTVKKRKSSYNIMRRRSSLLDPEAVAVARTLSAGIVAHTYADRQRRKLEIYLREMIRFLIFRAGSNRLCRFLELSALGVRLAGEGGYHGKEGTLILQSGNGIDFRKAWSSSLAFQRHKPRWFLVRQSYIVCVDSAEDMNIYDCFLVDSDFYVHPRNSRLRDQTKTKDLAKTAKLKAAHPQSHILQLSNAERKIKLLAKTDRQLLQFEESVKFMVSNTNWAKKNRYGSFAPVRTNCFAQWLVDGRDYMWNVSRAISMARDVIYIHDWWLSPEIYMRRPPAISQKWRLDRLLQRKAEEGVKIFVIVYRNINSAIPIDSEYTKFSLLDLHPNIYVQRSPNQVRQNVFFWAHHEKICVVDQTIAFCGGIDLCFGRWDTPAHLVGDDKLTGFEPTDVPKDADHCQLWPGKDYSNPKVLDFLKLDEPFGEMYDRTKVPRMPWHDVGMQVVGQPARDLTRHFIQRWNYVLRQRKPSRPTPFLLPPPDFMPSELEALGLDGTCNVQMLRSAGDWSIGTPRKTEDSIQSAYVKMIETSEHFVYIENQFFITSCMMDGTKIQNKIGDSLVERIIRAHEAREDWLAIIVLPLMPGFQNTVDSQDGSSIRLIMQCQYRSINRGDTSIFGRLQAAGIVPGDYIQFYSLRSWGKLGPKKALVTEQLYIHAKIMVVDDRFAIIGSANINDRSMMGYRDSEIAAMVSDNDMIDSVMGGESYKVGRFPHTLRMRLMREHLGVDTETLAEDELEHQHFHDHSVGSDDDRSSIQSLPTLSDLVTERKLVASKHREQDILLAKSDELHSFNHDIDWEQADNPHLKTNKRVTHDPRVTGNEAHKNDVDGFGVDNMCSTAKSIASRGRDSIILPGDIEVLVNDTAPEGKGTMASPKKAYSKTHLGNIGPHSREHDSPSTITTYPPPQILRLTTQELGLTQLSQLPALPITDDTDIGGPPLQRTFSAANAEDLNPVLKNMRRPVVDKDCMKDPLNDAFIAETWNTVAENNTKLFRQVFRCMPDDQVTTWKEYEAFVAYGERFAHSQGMAKSNMRMQQEAHGKTGPPGHGTANLPANVTAFKDKIVGIRDQDDGHAGGLGRKIGAKLIHKTHGLGKHQDKSRPGTQDTSGTGQMDASTRSGTMDEKNSAHQSNNNRTHIDFDAIAAEDNVNGMDTLNEKRSVPSGQNMHHGAATNTQKRRRRATTKSSGQLHATDPVIEPADAEELMKLVQGHLVLFPFEWLWQEERGGKWLYPVDQMAPLEIYD